MRGRLAALASAVALLAALVPSAVVRADPPPNCAPGDAICEQLVQSMNQQAADEARLAQIQSNINDVQKKMKALYAYIGQLNNQISAQQATIATTVVQINVLDAKIRATLADITRRQAHLDVREELFGQRARSIAKHGTVNYMALVLTAQNFNQLIDRVLMAQEIIHADRTLLDGLRIEKAHIGELKDRLAGQRNQENDLLTQQKAQEASLEVTRIQQQAAYTYLAQLEAQYKQQADEMARAIAAIADQVNMLQQAYAAEIANAGGGTGQFVWPLVPHWLTQGFGCSPYPFEIYWPSCPTRHFHTGIDIGEPYGSEIYAADSGVIGAYYTCCGYGIYGVIDHGNGYATLYGHMSGFAPGIHTGQVVYRGQVIGYEGSSGNSTGPHLHFEIRYNGNYVDPCAYLGC